MAKNPYGTSANPYDRGELVLVDDAIVDEGNMIAVNTSTGEAGLATAATANRRVVGWSKTYVDNTGDGKSVPVSREPRYFAGKSGDLPTQVGQTVYVHDENTVKLTADGSNPVTAGTILAINGSRFLVQFA